MLLLQPPESLDALRGSWTGGSRMTPPHLVSFSFGILVMIRNAPPQAQLHVVCVVEERLGMLISPCVEETATWPQRP